MCFKRKTKYDKEKESKNRINEMVSSVDVILDILKDEHAELKNRLNVIKEEIKYLNPTLDCKDEDKKILNTLDDLLIEINKSIKKDRYDEEKVDSLLDNLTLFVSRRKQIKKSF